MSLELIDIKAIRDHVGPGGPWAVEAGAKVRKHRKQLGEDKTETWLAARVGVSAQTIYQIEKGQVVPRDYLRAAIAFVLGKDSEDIWPPINRTRVGEIGSVD